MFNTSLKIAGGAAIAALASVAVAASDSPAQDGFYASKAIASGQYAQAEQQLRPASYSDARDPARLINLATVYVQTQRVGEARAALSRVQTLPDEMLLVAGGDSVSSHAIAKAMMQRLP